MARILVIEDEANLQEVLGYNLRQDGHEVLSALRGGEGLETARAKHPDLVILDLMLPDVQGTEICRALKRDDATREIPVIILTAKAEEIDRVVGFELGADDYVAKPFSVREVLLRVQAILRRAGHGGGADANGGADVITFGRLRIDRGAHRVWVDDEEVELTALEFRLLVTLHDRKNRVQSRAALLDDVWGVETAIETRTVDTHVKRLREKLGAAGAYVETIRGVGYRFRSTPEGAG